MKRVEVASLVVAVTLVFAAIATSSPAPCTVPSVLEDVHDSLVGEVGVSTLEIRWATDNEGTDLSHYEVWSRSTSQSERLLVVSPIGMCGSDTGYSVFVPLIYSTSYVVEVHSTQLTFHSLVLVQYTLDEPADDPR